MKKDNRHCISNLFDRLSRGGNTEPIEDLSEYEAVVDSLPPDQKEFVTVATRFAKLWEYLSEHNIPLPADLAAAMRELPALPHEERVAFLERINQTLMEWEDDASQGPEIRQ